MARLSSSQAKQLREELKAQGVSVTLRPGETLINAVNRTVSQATPQQSQALSQVAQTNPDLVTTAISSARSGGPITQEAAAALTSGRATTVQQAVAMTTPTPFEQRVAERTAVNVATEQKSQTQTVANKPVVPSTTTLSSTKQPVPVAKDSSLVFQGIQQYQSKVDAQQIKSSTGGTKITKDKIPTTSYGSPDTLQVYITPTGPTLQKATPKYPQPKPAPKGPMYYVDLVPQSFEKIGSDFETVTKPITSTGAYKFLFAPPTTVKSFDVTLSTKPTGTGTFMQTESPTTTTIVPGTGGVLTQLEMGTSKYVTKPLVNLVVPGGSETIYQAAETTTAIEKSKGQIPIVGKTQATIGGIVETLEEKPLQLAGTAAASVPLALGMAAVAPIPLIAGGVAALGAIGGALFIGSTTYTALTAPTSTEFGRSLGEGLAFAGAGFAGFEYAASSRLARNVQTGFISQRTKSFGAKSYKDVTKGYETFEWSTPKPEVKYLEFSKESILVKQPPAGFKPIDIEALRIDTSKNILLEAASKPSQRALPGFSKPKVEDLPFVKDVPNPEFAQKEGIIQTQLIRKADYDPLTEFKIKYASREVPDPFKQSQISAQQERLVPLLEYKPSMQVSAKQFEYALPTQEFAATEFMSQPKKIVKGYDVIDYRRIDLGVEPEFAKVQGLKQTTLTGKIPKSLEVTEYGEVIVKPFDPLNVVKEKIELLNAPKLVSDNPLIKAAANPEQRGLFGVKVVDQSVPEVIDVSISSRSYQRTIQEFTYPERKQPLLDPSRLLEYKETPSNIKLFFEKYIPSSSNIPKGGLTVGSGELGYDFENLGFFKKNVRSKQAPPLYDYITGNVEENFIKKDFIDKVYSPENKAFIKYPQRYNIPEKIVGATEVGLAPQRPYIKPEYKLAGFISLPKSEIRPTYTTDLFAGSRSNIRQDVFLSPKIDSILNTGQIGIQRQEGSQIQIGVQEQKRIQVQEPKLIQQTEQVSKTIFNPPIEPVLEPPRSFPPETPPRRTPPGFPTFSPPPIIPPYEVPFNRPPDFPRFDFGFQPFSERGVRRYYKPQARKYKVLPSFRAVLFDVYGKTPKPLAGGLYSGEELRPVTMRNVFVSEFAGGKKKKRRKSLLAPYVNMAM